MRISREEQLNELKKVLMSEQWKLFIDDVEEEPAAEDDQSNNIQLLHRRSRLISIDQADSE